MNAWISLLDQHWQPVYHEPFKPRCGGGGPGGGRTVVVEWEETVRRCQPRCGSGRTRCRRARRTAKHLAEDLLVVLPELALGVLSIEARVSACGSAVTVELILSARPEVRQRSSTWGRRSVGSTGN